MASEAESINELAAAYEQTTLRWEELAAEPAEANKLVKEHHSIYKRLREDDDVRE